MSDMKTSPAGSSKPADVEPVLSPDSQRDLDDALDETPTAEDVKKEWVQESIRDLYRTFAVGRKAGQVSVDRTIEEFSAVEGTENDLRKVLVSIAELARYSTDSY